MPRLAIVPLLLFAIAPLAPAQEDGFRVIFDGKSLDGWNQVGPGSFEQVDEGYKTVGGMGLLWYEPETFGDCVIRVVYKAEDGRDNSGVSIRIAEKPDDPWFAVHHGFEVQICDQADPLHRTGAIYSYSASTATPAQAGQWNTMEITLDGEEIRVSVNGEEVNRFDPTSDPIPPRRQDYEPIRGPRPTRGYLGLQNHGDGDVVFFKEVSVRPLAGADASD
ncbi:3-keto-disaccharide hydrolase [Tautonia sociabilis]|uniref:DUF1080 domain-containing protein n=1 Tax=Tautonia sociabilis TaxID=2080755 RepID=A0A432MHM5_9BACT|nr:DUF1080 domain-containing protein [Tautonia sociabilis]RUL86848.1 DUF1080 domain-containing protein [Tautonia sociabilis]